MAARLREWPVQEEALPALQKGPGQHRTRRSSLLKSILDSENPLTKPKVTTLFPGSSKPGKAIRSLDYESSPSYPVFRSVGARGGCPGPSITKKRTFRRLSIVAIRPMNYRMANKLLVYWAFCDKFVSFIFKFGSNWTIFDVSAQYRQCSGP